MSISFNPYIVISWIPIGNIKFTPTIYASIIPLDNTTADTLRIIHNNQSINSDSQRRITNSQSIFADTNRHIHSNQFINSDSIRFIRSTQSISIDTLRRVTKPQGNIIISPAVCVSIVLPDFFDVDTLRRISNYQSIFADTLVLFAQSFSADTNRNIINSQSIFADTQRNITAPDSIVVDTCRQLREILYVDTERQIINAQSCDTETIVRVPHILNYFIQDLPVKLNSFKKLANDRPIAFMNTLKDFGIISLNLSLNSMALTDTISIESSYRFNVNDALLGQLFNYNFNFLVENTVERNSIQTVNGMYDKDLLLYTQVKLGQYELSKTLTDYDIYILRQQATAAHTLFNMNIEDNGKLILSSITDVGGEVKTSYAYYYAPDGHQMNKDEVLRFLIASYSFSANYIKCVANALGLKTYICINDFQNTQLSNYLDNYATYMEIIQNAYSWSSKIPQRQINVFIRGDTLYVIQRGLESSTFDISNLPHIVVSIEHKLLRTIWQQNLITEKWSSEESKTDLEPPDSDNDDDNNDEDDKEDDDDNDDDNEEDDDEEDDEENSQPYTGEIHYEAPTENENGSISMTIKYENGLMASNSKNISIYNSETGMSTTTTSKTEYSYDYYYPKVEGQPSMTPKNKNKNKNKKQQKPAVYSNEKAFKKALKQWYKQRDKAQQQYQKQLNKLQRQQSKALNQMNNRSPIYFLSSEESTITTTNKDNDSTETIKQEITKLNYYDGIGDSTYLFEERELTTTTTSYSSNNSSDSSDSSNDDEEISVRQTFHSPVGNGYYAHTQYLDGEFQSASLSQGKPFQQVTQFTADQIQKGWSKSNSGGSGSNSLEPPDIGPAPVFEPENENNKNPNPAGNSGSGGQSYHYSSTYEIDVDSSFPTDDKNVAIELEAALQWLNRKIQETITVEIYGKVINGIPEVQHIVDFTERIAFNGNVYFLESNNINLTPNKLSQTLKIVRWF